MKKIIFGLSALLVLALVSACSTPESRIRGQLAVFNGWPVDVQQKVQAGQVDIGFTHEMVQVALGEADRFYTRTTSKGASEVWVYFDRGPKFAVGVGVGGYSGHTAYGTSITVGNEPFGDNEVLRVVFEHGHVVAIERRN